VQGPLPREPGNARLEKYIALTSASAEAGGAKPVGFASFASYGLNEYALGVREQAPKISFLQEAYKSLRIVGRVGASQAARRLHEKKAPAATSVAEPSRVAMLSQLAAKARGPIVNEADAKTILGAFGIGVPPERKVVTLEDALRAADEIGYPVVLKFLSSAVLHKSDIGGVHLNLRSAQDLRRAFDLTRASLRRHSVREEGYLVAQFVEGGAEMALGIHNDPEVGPLVMVGAGGVLLELMKDVEFGAVPLTHTVAQAMVRRLKSHKLLTGFRGKPPLDVDALCSAMVQLGQLAVDCSGIVESVDINPLVVMPRGCVALDAAIVLKPRPAEHAKPAAANG